MKYVIISLSNIIIQLRKYLISIRYYYILIRIKISRNILTEARCINKLIPIILKISINMILNDIHCIEYIRYI